MSLLRNGEPYGGSSAEARGDAFKRAGLPVHRVRIPWQHAAGYADARADSL